MFEEFRYVRERHVCWVCSICTRFDVLSVLIFAKITSMHFDTQDDLRKHFAILMLTVEAFLVSFSRKSNCKH